MRAVVFTEYGPPEVLHLKEVEKPVPKDDEILIRIHATVVTRTDTSIRGLPMKGNRKTRKQVCLGTYLAGEVEAVGKRAKRFKVGDKVFGGGKLVGGCYSEYKCLPERRAVFPMPSHLTYE